MSLARPLLVLACAALLAACAAQDLAPGSVNQCTSKIWGTQAGTIIQLPVVYLNPDPGVTDYNIKIPNNCKRKQKPYGELAQVCDDVKPTVVFPSLTDPTSLFVHRNGQANEAAPVFITQYCP